MKRLSARFAGLVLLVTCVAFSSVEVAANTEVDASYYDLGDFERLVTARVPEAQTWFNRGLLQSYAFNHEEAVRCFQKAAELDTQMAMAYWGIAYALGPNYNNPVMEQEASLQAYASVRQAMEHAATASPVEQALIGALSKRYSEVPPEDRAALDLAYADAMREVHVGYPDDSDVAAMFAEALMQLRPWALWSAEGKAAPETAQIRQVLESALTRTPEHPALCHFYIHTMEPSPYPEKAVPAANALRERVPQAGHLVHMPSHIDVLLGDYAAVVRTNQKAIAADELFVAKQGRQNFFTLYRLHNFHFLVYGAMFDGQNELALQSAEELVDEIPAELLAAWPDFVEAFVPTPLHVLVRFGRWNEILAFHDYPPEQPFSRAIRHYARTLAYASTGKLEKARVELELLGEVSTEVPESRLLFNNTCRQILGVAIAMAQGEVEYRRGNFGKSFDFLRTAVRLDDALNYDEPWGWMQPARHALGALLLEQGHLVEAEQVYRDDLKRHPKNGWALHGLAEALRRQGNNGEAETCDAQLADTWTRSDIELQASCFCRTSSRDAGARDKDKEKK